MTKIRNVITILGSSALLSTPAIAQDGISSDVDYSEGGWSRSKAFGWFAPLDGSWLYHHEHGFMAEVPVGPNSSYLWSQGQGWWFINLHAFPWIYDAESGEWVYYGGKADVRWFFRPGKGHWITDVQQENLKDLRRLLKDVRKDSEVTPDLVEAYRNALKTLVENTEGPSEETLDAYAELHAAVVADAEVTDEEKEALRVALDAVLESIVVAEADAEAVRQAWLAIVDASNISEEDRAELEELIASVVEDLRDRRPGWGRDDHPGRPDRPGKPHMPGLRHAYSMMLALSDALVELLEPNRQPEMAFIRNFVRDFGKALVDEDISEEEHEAITKSIVLLRKKMAPSVEQDRGLYNMLKRFANARVEDDLILADVNASIDLGFGIEPENPEVDPETPEEDPEVDPETPEEDPEADPETPEEDPEQDPGLPEEPEFPEV